MSKNSRLKAAVEGKTGEIRGLAIAMRGEVQSLGYFRRRESQVIEAWADSLDAIANGLTTAVADADPENLRRMFRYLGVALLLVVPPAIDGATQAGVEEFFSERTIRQAETVGAGVEDLVALSFQPWDEPEWSSEEYVPPEFAAVASNPEQLDEYLSHLDARSRFAVEATYGMIDGKRKPLDFVADQLGTTTESARKILARAESILRHPQTLSDMTPGEPRESDEEAD